MVELNLVSAFNFGLISSMTACLAACLPVFLPILFGYADDTKKGVKLSLGFALGRFIGYFTLGIAAAIMGGAFIKFFDDSFPLISTWMIFIFGILTIFYGTLILAKTNLKFLHKKKCANYLKKTDKFNNPLIASTSLGFISTITPCVPVFTFLLLPFAVGKVFETSLMTIAFGLGANVIFVVIAIFTAMGVKQLKEKFTNIKRNLEVFSSVFMIVFGLFYMLWATGPLFFDWQYPNHLLPTFFDFVDFVKQAVFRL